MAGHLGGHAPATREQHERQLRVGADQGRQPTRGGGAYSVAVEEISCRNQHLRATFGGVAAHRFQRGKLAIEECPAGAVRP